MRDDKPVPEPGEAARDEDDEIHYHEVDETNVSGADRLEKPPADDRKRSQVDE
jgi:hypothetical protein